MVSLPGTVPRKPLHKGQLGRDRGVCRLLMNLPVEDVPQRRDGTRSGPDETSGRWAGHTEGLHADSYRPT